MPNTLIARNLGVSEATVRNHIAKLIDNKVIQIVAVADPFKIGLGITALIDIQADIAKVDSVAEELKNIDEIWYIALATGASNFDVEVYLPSIERLDDLLRNKIWKIDGVLHTTTSIVLSYIKRDYRWKF
ncbi:MAG TPA: Lrp/AsnC family transcriptional regulator [Firmicutes bacterium]|nr:Lrp/AsnC family transcriptional regulator [Bacillota bacterium]